MKEAIRIIIILAAVLPAIAVLSPYADAKQAGPDAPDPNVQYLIDGSGESSLLIDRWSAEIKNIHDNVNLSYQSIGSTAGVENYLNGDVSFAVTDAPLTKSEMKTIGPTLHIPKTISAVNIVYNHPDLPDGIKLTGRTVADIFEGKITSWNAPEISQTNPQIDLPAADITVVYTDGSDTTKVFTQWLSSVSDTWKQNVGAGNTVIWPVGLGSTGTSGMTDTLLSTPGAIGYVSMAYSIQNDMKNAAIENGDKTDFVYPSLDTTTAAAASLTQTLPPAQGWWTNVDLLNTPGKDSYPVSTFTYLILPEDITHVTDSTKARGLVWMLHWMVTDGQQYAPELGFVPLSDDIAEIAKLGLARIRYDNSIIWDYNPIVQDDSGREFRIDGAGASFAFPMMDLWRVKYGESHPNVKFNYQSIGSGGGVKQHIEKTVSFAASDAPLRASEYEKAPGSITIPEMIGAISLAYNIPGVQDSGLKLTEDALCGIFLGTITKWDDPLIAGANPRVELSSDSIATVHRSDGSGTTFAFTEYLSKVCPAWDEQIGYGKSVPWPIGVGAAGNEGVAGVIKTTPNSIGYVTLAYAFQTGMTTAAIQNGDHTNFVLPTIQSASDASSGAATLLPDASDSWEGVNLLAAPGENSYPITSFSYIILHPDLKGSVVDIEHAKAALDLIAWMITDGQKYSPELQYVPISVPVVNIGLEGISKVTYDGQPVYTGITSIGQDAPELELPVQQDAAKIPEWLRHVFKFYADGNITEDELLNGLRYLIQEGVIKI